MCAVANWFFPPNGKLSCARDERGVTAIGARHDELEATERF